MRAGKAFEAMATCDDQMQLALIGIEAALIAGARDDAFDTLELIATKAPHDASSSEMIARYYERLGKLCMRKSERKTREYCFSKAREFYDAAGKKGRSEYLLFNFSFQ